MGWTRSTGSSTADDGGVFFFFQAEDGIRDSSVTGVQTCALPIYFDLEFARPFLDTLPFAGRLSGHTTASGPLAALALTVDWAFRDSLVPGRPETRLRGQGEVNLRAPDGIHFQPFMLAASSVDLGTVRPPAPAGPPPAAPAAAGALPGPPRHAPVPR